MKLMISLMKMNSFSRVGAILLITLLSNGVFAQSDKVQTAANYLKYNKLDEAKELIDAAVVHPTTQENNKAWHYRTEIYKALAKRAKEVEKDDNKFMDYYTTSYESAKKCISYDPKGKYKANSSKVVDEYRILSSRIGYEALQKNDFANSSKYLDQYLNTIEFMKGLKLIDENYNDTFAYLYSGFSFLQIKEIEKAENNLQKSIDLKVTDPLAYNSLADLYMQKLDTPKAINILTDGVKNVKDKKDLLIKMMNVYIAKNELKKVVELSDEVIQMDPNNHSIYQALGSIYLSEFNDMKKAEQYFQKSLEINPDNLKSYQDMGFMYFNNAADIYNNAQSIKDQKKYDAEMEKAKEQWNKAVPVLEKALTLDKDYKLISENPTKENASKIRNAGLVETLRVLAQTYAQLSKYEESTKTRNLYNLFTN